MAAQVQNAIPEAIAFFVSNGDGSHGTEPIFRRTPEGMLMFHSENEFYQKEDRGGVPTFKPIKNTRKFSRTTSKKKQNKIWIYRWNQIETEKRLSTKFNFESGED